MNFQRKSRAENGTLGKFENVTKIRLSLILNSYKKKTWKILYQFWRHRRYKVGHIRVSFVRMGSVVCSTKSICLFGEVFVPRGINNPVSASLRFAYKPIKRSYRQ